MFLELFDCLESVFACKTEELCIGWIEHLKIKLSFIVGADIHRIHVFVTRVHLPVTPHLSHIEHILCDLQKLVLCSFLLICLFMMCFSTCVLQESQNDLSNPTISGFTFSAHL